MFRYGGVHEETREQEHERYSRHTKVEVHAGHVNASVSWHVLMERDRSNSRATQPTTARPPPGENLARRGDRAKYSRDTRLPSPGLPSRTLARCSKPSDASLRRPLSGTTADPSPPHKQTQKRLDCAASRSDGTREGATLEVVGKQSGWRLPMTEALGSLPIHLEVIQVLVVHKALSLCNATGSARTVANKLVAPQRNNQ